MERLLTVQTFGVSVVLASVIGAEVSAWYLAACPTSAFAWSLNLGPFHIFEAARLSPSPLGLLFGPLSLPIAIALLAGTVLAQHLKSRFAIALAANLSFGFCVSLADAMVPTTPDGSYGPLSALLARPDHLLAVAGLCLVSLTACIASHIGFVLAIRSEQRVSTSRGTAWSSITWIDIVRVGARAA